MRVEDNGIIADDKNLTKFRDFVYLFKNLHVYFTICSQLWTESVDSLAVRFFLRCKRNQHYWFEE